MRYWRCGIQICRRKLWTHFTIRRLVKQLKEGSRRRLFGRPIRITSLLKGNAGSWIRAWWPKKQLVEDVRWRGLDGLKYYLPYRSARKRIAAWQWMGFPV